MSTATDDSGRFGGVSPVAPPVPGPVMFDQRWESVFFLHWPVDPSDVAPFMPPGVRPDEFDGATYVALVPFRMSGAGLGRGHPMPWWGTFVECNVRLYSVDDEGNHGVVFRSLEASRLVTALAARWGYQLPYTWALMSVRQRGDHWWWRSERRHPRGGGSLTLEARVGEPVEPTDLEVFLTARWGLHSHAAGRTWWTPNEHAPWPLHTAEVLHLDEDLVHRAGFDAQAESMLRPLFSPGVYTTFGFPRAL